MQVAENNMREQIEAMSAAGPEPMTEEQIDQLVAQQVPQMLSMLEQQGMIEKTEGGYRAKASFKNGELMVNGVAVPLPI